MVKKGDVIEILPSEEVYPEHKIKIEVIFEDEYMAIVNKPAGLLTSGNQHRTLANAISTNLNESKEKARLPRPNPVHRLDRSASGLLIIAKTMLAQQDLSEQLANYTVDKTYRVISHGLAEKTGTVDLPIKEKSAQTQYKLIKTIPSNKYGGFSIMDVKIKQGRKNQIRVHLHSIGHTVVGDLLYPRENPGKGLYLHCYALTLNHPESGEKMTFEMDLPKKFEDFLN
jgi:RluA family pseudouridine synthase